MARRPVSSLGSMETGWRRKGYWENQNGGQQYYFFHFFVNMSFWASVMCQEENSQSLEGVSPVGVINYGKNLLKRFDSLYKLRGSSKFPGAWQQTSNGEVLTKELTLWYSLWYWNNLSDWGKRATNWLGPWKGLKLTVEMPKMTVEMLKIWQISLPR